MKIGDRVLINGYVDEIRKDTIIIRNNGGYFGTVESEVITLHRGHGRLIDADALEESFSSFCRGECGCCNEDKCPVFHQPTVIEIGKDGEE